MASEKLALQSNNPPTYFQPNQRAHQDTRAQYWLLRVMKETHTNRITEVEDYMPPRQFNVILEMNPSQTALYFEFLESLRCFKKSTKSMDLTTHLHGIKVFD